MLPVGVSKGPISSAGITEAGPAQAGNRFAPVARRRILPIIVVGFCRNIKAIMIVFSLVRKCREQFIGLLTPQANASNSIINVTV
jgi:hypothetical protein